MSKSEVGWPELIKISPPADLFYQRSKPAEFNRCKVTGGHGFNFVVLREGMSGNEAVLDVLKTNGDQSFDSLVEILGVGYDKVHLAVTELFAARRIHVAGPQVILGHESIQR